MPHFGFRPFILRTGEIVLGAHTVALCRDGGRSLFDAAEFGLERRHLRAQRGKLLRAFRERGALLRLFIEREDTFFPFAGGLERGRGCLFLCFEDFEPCLCRRVVFFGHFRIRFEACLSELAFSFRRRITGVGALDEPVAVFFEVEQAGDELQSVCPRGADELRKFPLRERDAFFEIALFEPDDALQKRVALPHPVRNDDKFLAFLFIYLDGLGGVLAFEFALDAEDTTPAFEGDLERKMHIRLFEGEVDDIADAARTRTGNVAVEGKADAV